MSSGKYGGSQRSVTPHLDDVVDEKMTRFYENPLKNIMARMLGEPLFPMGR